MQKRSSETINGSKSAQSLRDTPTDVDRQTDQKTVWNMKKKKSKAMSSDKVRLQ